MGNSQLEAAGPSGLPACGSAPAGGRRWPAVLTLLLLAPLITEFLFGSTQLSNAGALVVEIPIWGCGALLCRELVRRRQRGWPALLGMGLALSIAEEFLICQTSVAPLLGTSLEHPYARWLGVNWTYLLWALGYESIWAVLMPVTLTEMVFPAHRDKPWLRRGGLIICGTVFVLGSLLGWYFWTQVVVAKLNPAYAYTPPLGTLMAGVAAIAVLVSLSLAPRRWAAGVVAFVLALIWFGLVVVTYSDPPALPPVAVLAAGAAVAVVAVLLLRRWSAGAEWADAHRLALCTGALLASMLVGFGVLRGMKAGPVDVIGKLVLNVLALVLLALLGRAVRRRRQAPEPPHT